VSEPKPNSQASPISKSIDPSPFTEKRIIPPFLRQDKRSQSDSSRQPVTEEAVSPILTQMPLAQTPIPLNSSLPTGEILENAISVQETLHHPQTIDEPSEYTAPSIASDVETTNAQEVTPSTVLREEDANNTITEEPSHITIPEVLTEFSDEVPIEEDTTEDLIDGIETITPDKPSETEAPPDPFAMIGKTPEEYNELRTKELEKENDGYTGSRKFSDAELMEMIDYTTTHYRIIEAQNYEMAKIKQANIDVSKRKIVRMQDAPDFDIQKLRSDKIIADGKRMVQVVAVQSGYTVFVKSMSSSELRTFARRMGNEDTYAFEMAMCKAIHSKLTDFSIGELSFEKWMNVTAYPDLQTLFFGLYMAIYPTQRHYNIVCNYCDERIYIPINHDSLIMVPPGSIYQEQIKTILYGTSDPKELVAQSQRFTPIDVYFDNNIRFFRVRTPSIIEFLENAYHHKRDAAIDANPEDAFLTGYIRGYGVLDIELFNKTGEVTYLFDTRPTSIDYALSQMNVEDKSNFRRDVFNYVNRYSVGYQVPRLLCPHCKRVMQQRDLNMRSLFLAIRAQSIL
jgi:hypothetical protein